MNTRRAFSAEVKGTSLAVAEFGVALQQETGATLVSSPALWMRWVGFMMSCGRKVLHVDQQVMKLVEWSDGVTTSVEQSE